MYPRVFRYFCRKNKLCDQNGQHHKQCKKAGSPKPCIWLARLQDLKTLLNEFSDGYYGGPRSYFVRHLADDELSCCHLVEVNGLASALN